MEFTDRYQALGIPYPAEGTVCQGQCEGTGMVPVAHYEQPAVEGECRVVELEDDPRLLALWREGHRKCSTLGRFLQFFRFDLAVRYGWKTHWSIVTERCDGWHFVKCPDCGGSGKR